jgi:histidyl-tRNA synthetase
MAKAGDARPEARKPRGFPDKTAAILAAERRLVDAILGVYARWGFDPVDTGPFEYVDALGKFLPDTDRPNAGVFALQDDDEQWIALRYDHTAPLARYAAEHWDRLPKPFRRSAAGPVWRNEKPGPFRFREFIQCDADIVGAAGPASDAEIIALAAEAMQATGAGRFEVRVNTRRLFDGVMAAAGVTSPEQSMTVLRALDKFDRLGVEGVSALLGKGRRDESGDFTHGAGLSQSQIDRFLGFAQARGTSRAETVQRLATYAGGSEAGDKGLRELSDIDAVLKAIGVPEAAAVYDPAIVRGLEYYTGPVMELELLEEVRDAEGRLTRMGSAGGGGRYDDLVARFRGELVPATGVSIGVSRLAHLLSARETPPPGPVLVLVLDADQVAEACAMTAELRTAGIVAETYLGASGMRAQMKYADRRGAPAVVIVGEDERKQGLVTVKDLKAGAEAARTITDNDAWRSERPGQVQAPRADLVPVVRRILQGAS